MRFCCCCVRHSIKGEFLCHIQTFFKVQISQIWLFLCNCRFIWLRDNYNSYIYCFIVFYPVASILPYIRHSKTLFVFLFFYCRIKEKSIILTHADCTNHTADSHNTPYLTHGLPPVIVIVLPCLACFLVFWFLPVFPGLTPCLPVQTLFAPRLDYCSCTWVLSLPCPVGYRSPIEDPRLP